MDKGAELEWTGGLRSCDPSGALERAEEGRVRRALGLREMADPTERRPSKFLWP